MQTLCMIWNYTHNALTPITQIMEFKSKMCDETQLSGNTPILDCQNRDHVAEMTNRWAFMLKQLQVVSLGFEPGPAG